MLRSKKSQELKLITNEKKSKEEMKTDEPVKSEKVREFIIVI